MEARVGTLAVGTQFDTLLTGRRGVVHAQYGRETAVGFGVGSPPSAWTAKLIHPDVRVRVVEVTH